DRLTNSLAAVTDTYGYQGFGLVYVNTGSSVNRYRFVGRLGGYWEIDNGRLILRARPYNPPLQIFLSHDPLRNLVGAANPYTYSGNSPGNRVDPTGLFPWRLSDGNMPIRAGKGGAFYLPRIWTVIPKPTHLHGEGAIVQHITVSWDIRVWDDRS